MAARVGLTRDDVVQAAAAHADELGLETLNVTVLAERLGIRSQSVYAHVEGMEEILAALQMQAYRLMGERVAAAVRGLSGRPALIAWISAHMEFDLEHPGLFAARNRPPTDDPELWTVIHHASETWMRLLETYGLEGEDAMHFARLVWATLLGFVSMYHARLFTMPVDPAQSFRRTIEGLADQIEHRSREIGFARPGTRRTRTSSVRQRKVG